MDTKVFDPRRATYACVQCRTLKRKCTRELPTCSLCVRLRKACDYSATNSNTAPLVNEDSEVRDWNLGGLSIGFSIAKPENFPARYFLNSATHQRLSLDAFPAIPTPSDTLSLLGSTKDVQSLCEKYISEIQNWLPFLRKERIAQHILSFEVRCDIRLTLLLLSMKLVTTSPAYQQDAVTSLLYQTVRDLSAKVENAFVISLELIQAKVLLSVYEMGHGIYPAAFLSIAHAARLCVTMGFHDRKSAPRLFKEPATWALLEEERRTWWVVLILDRFSQLGIPGLPLATPEPTYAELLPCTDSEWDNEEIGVNEPLFHRPFTAECRVGAFANMCQSAHILGRVLEHRNIVDTCIDNQVPPKEAQQLHETLTSLTKHLAQRYADEKSAAAGYRLVAMSLCYSARLIIYTTHFSIGPTEAEIPRRESALEEMCRKGTEDMIYCIKELVQHVLAFKDSNFVRFGPLICHTIYQGASCCASVIRERGDQEQLDYLKLMINCLKVLGGKWKVVEEYLKMLKDEGVLSLLDP